MDDDTLYYLGKELIGCPKCTCCNANLLFENRFCTKCGSRSPHFREEILIRDYEVSLTEQLVQCQTMGEDFHNPQREENYNFCFVCGTLLRK